MDYQRLVDLVFFFDTDINYSMSETESSHLSVTVSTENTALSIIYGL